MVFDVDSSKIIFAEATRANMFRKGLSALTDSIKTIRDAGEAKNHSTVSNGRMTFNTATKKFEPASVRTNNPDFDEKTIKGKFDNFDANGNWRYKMGKVEDYSDDESEKKRLMDDLSKGNVKYDPHHRFADSKGNNKQFEQLSGARKEKISGKAASEMKAAIKTAK